MVDLIQKQNTQTAYQTTTTDAVTHFIICALFIHLFIHLFVLLFSDYTHFCKQKNIEIWENPPEWNNGWLDDI